MSNANIEKTSDTIAVPESLTQKERTKLRNKTSGRWNMAVAEEATKLNKGTIYNAIAGRRLMPENLKIVRAFLSGQAETKNS